MRVINFLPGDYLVRQGAKRATLVCVAIAGGALLLLGVVTGFVFVRAVGVAAMRAAVEMQYAEASKQIDDLKQLEERKQGLLHKVELSTALLERVPRSHILARLTNFLPPDTSLTSLMMKVEEKLVEVTPSPASGTPAAAGGRPGGAAKAKPQKVRVKRVRFRLDGLAQTDVQVAEYLSRLGTDPLFDQVDLQFSEEFPFEEGVTMRRFQLSFLLSEEAEKALETYTAPEAEVSAAASPAPNQPIKGES